MSNVSKDTSTFIADRRAIHGGCHFQCCLWFFHHPPDLAILSSTTLSLWSKHVTASDRKLGFVFLFFFCTWEGQIVRVLVQDMIVLVFFLIFRVLDALRWLMMALVCNLFSLVIVMPHTAMTKHLQLLVMFKNPSPLKV